MKENNIVFVPKGINIREILSIIKEFGWDNDTMTCDKYGENIIPYKISIEVTKVKDK